MANQPPDVWWREGRPLGHMRGDYNKGTIEQVSQIMQRGQQLTFIRFAYGWRRALLLRNRSKICARHMTGPDLRRVKCRSQHRMFSKPARTPLNGDILGVICSYTVRETLRTGLSLVSTEALLASRNYLVVHIQLDLQRMVEYHTLQRDAEEANVRFSLPLRHTKVVQLCIPRICTEEITAFSHLVRVTSMKPTALDIHANLCITGGIRANAYARFILPMQTGFAGVQTLRFASSAKQWDEDILFWLALCPQAVVVTTYPYDMVLPATNQACRLPHSLPRALESTNPLADAIINQRIDKMRPLPPDPSAGELVDCCFPPQSLVVSEDAAERMLRALKSWQLRGMTFRLTLVTLDVLYWSDHNGVVLMHHLLLACRYTLQRLVLGTLKEKRKSCRCAEIVLISPSQLGLCG